MGTLPVVRLFRLGTAPRFRDRLLGPIRPLPLILTLTCLLPNIALGILGLGNCGDDYSHLKHRTPEERARLRRLAQLIDLDRGVGKKQRTPEELTRLKLRHTNPTEIARRRRELDALAGRGGVFHLEPPPQSLLTEKRFDPATLTGDAKLSFEKEVAQVLKDRMDQETRRLVSEGMDTAEAERIVEGKRAEFEAYARHVVTTLTYEVGPDGKPVLSQAERDYLEVMRRDGQRLIRDKALEKALARLDDLYVGYEELAQERHVARFTLQRLKALQSEGGKADPAEIERLETRLKGLDAHYTLVNDMVNLVGNIRQRIEAYEYLTNGAATPLRVFASADAFNLTQTPWYTNGIETKRSHDAAGVGILWKSNGTPAVRTWALANDTPGYSNIFPGGAWRAPLTRNASLWGSSRANRNIYSVEGNRSLNYSGVIIPEGEVFATSFTGNRNTEAFSSALDPMALVRDFLTGGGLQSERQYVHFVRQPDGTLLRVVQTGQPGKDNQEKLDNWIRNELVYPGIVPKTNDYIAYTRALYNQRPDWAGKSSVSPAERKARTENVDLIMSELRAEKERVERAYGAGRIRQPERDQRLEDLDAILVDAELSREFIATGTLSFDSKKKAISLQFKR